MLPEQLYVEFYDLLRGTAVYRYGVPEQDAEDLVQDVFTSFISKPEPIENARAYLLGAIRLASRLYWRREAKFDREAAIPERAARPPIVFLRNLTKWELEVLVLRMAGWSIKEIAARLGCSPSWAEKKLRSARKVLAEEIDLPNRRGKGGCVGRTDNLESVFGSQSAVRGSARAHGPGCCPPPTANRQPQPL